METSVSTARITPSNVRKLRNLCARRASRASFRVSTKVSQPRRNRSQRDMIWPAVPASGGIAVISPRDTDPIEFSTTCEDELSTQFVSTEDGILTKLDA